MSVRIGVERVAAATPAAARAGRLVDHLAASRDVDVRVAPSAAACGADLFVAVTPDGVTGDGGSTVAWVDTISVEGDTRWSDLAPVRWAATSATAAAALRRRRRDARVVVAEPPGDPAATPLLSPDPSARRHVVVPAEGLDDDRLRLVLDAYAAVPGTEPLVLLGADVAAADQRVRCVLRPDPAERADLLRHAVVTVLAGRRQAEPTAAIEAFGVGAGVVACTDGGAVRELVRDRVTGRVVVPGPGPLAEVLEVQVGIRQEPVRHGARGRVVWESLTWRRCLSRLLGALWRTPRAAEAR